MLDTDEDTCDNVETLRIQAHERLFKNAGQAVFNKLLALYWIGRHWQCVGCDCKAEKCYNELLEKA